VRHAQSEREALVHSQEPGRRSGSLLDRRYEGGWDTCGASGRRTPGGVLRACRVIEARGSRKHKNDDRQQNDCYQNSFLHTSPRITLRRRFRGRWQKVVTCRFVVGSCPPAVVGRPRSLLFSSVCSAHPPSTHRRRLVRHPVNNGKCHVFAATPSPDRTSRPQTVPRAAQPSRSRKRGRGSDSAVVEQRAVIDDYRIFRRGGRRRSMRWPERSPFIRSVSTSRRRRALRPMSSACPLNRRSRSSSSSSRLIGILAAKVGFRSYFPKHMQ
jgi:hypothetical protein